MEKNKDVQDAKFSACLFSFPRYEGSNKREGDLRATRPPGCHYVELSPQPL